MHCWSGGGPAAYRLAVRHPHRVRALVAFAAVSRAYPTPKLKFIDRLLFQTRPGNKLLGYLAAKQPEQFVSGVLASEGSLTKQQLKERVAHVMADPVKREFVVGLGLTAEQTAERRIGYDNDIEHFSAITSLELEKVTAPTLVVHGTADSDVPYEHGVFAASQIPGSGATADGHGDPPRLLHASGLRRCPAPGDGGAVALSQRSGRRASTRYRVECATNGPSVRRRASSARSRSA